VKPVDGAEYMVAGGSEDDGTFALPQVPPGRYRLTARADGFAQTDQDLEVPAGRDLQGVEVALAATQGLRLNVRTAAGRVPPFISVRVESPQGVLAVAESRPVDSQGAALLATVPPGAWTVWVSAPGAALVKTAVTVPGEPVAVVLPDAGRLDLRVPALASSDQVASLALLAPDRTPLSALAPDGALLQQWPVVGGKALVEGVPPGAWTVLVTAPDGRTFTGAAALAAPADTAVTLQ
jgi:hypothetical protein